MNEREALDTVGRPVLIMFMNGVKPMSQSAAAAIQAFLAKHGKTQRDFAAGSGLWLSQVSAVTNGANVQAKTANKVLRYFRTLDPAVTFEDFWGEPAPTKGRTRRRSAA